MAEGFDAVKIKVGMKSLEDDLRRIRREAVGLEVRLMVDANQAFDGVEALQRGRAYQE
jgi:L-alanine-DL-glutamate epimerase-like enolase superfamily enzyme